MTKDDTRHDTGRITHAAKADFLDLSFFISMHDNGDEMYETLARIDATSTEIKIETGWCKPS